MVRNCIVPGCRESDLTALTHRFPKSIEISEAWREALNLEYSVEELQKRFVVCTKHFSGPSYRNINSSCLNTSAIPNLYENPDNERIANERQVCKRRQSSLNSSKVLANAPITPLVEIKRLKLDPANAVSKNYILLNEEIQRMSKRNEFLDDTKHVQEPEFEEEENVVYDEVENEELLSQYVTDEVILEESVPYTPTFTDSAAQTDIEKPETTKNATSSEAQESKDDKIVKMMYPEYSGKSKMKLIDIICEKDQKIQNLEDKIAKLEAAMRQLL